MNDNYNLGANIKRALQLVGKTQTELAEYLKVDKSHVSKWVNNHVRPNRDNIADIAKFTERSIEQILSGYFNERRYTKKETVESPVADYKVTEIELTFEQLGKNLIKRLSSTSGQCYGELEKEIQEFISDELEITRKRMVNLINLR